MQIVDLTHKENSFSKHNAKTISEILSIVEKLKNANNISNNSSSNNNALKILLVNNSSALGLKATSGLFTYTFRFNETRRVHKSFFKKSKNRKKKVLPFFQKASLFFFYRITPFYNWKTWEISLFLYETIHLLTWKKKLVKRKINSFQ